MPDEGVVQVTHEEILSYDEIVTVCKAAATLGIKKIKVTGGEPLVRLGVSALIRQIKDIPGIENVTLTTNGVLLEDKIDELAAAGIDGINISLDSIDAMAFKEITGFDLLSKVLGGIEKTLKYESIPLKVNCVPMKRVAKSPEPEVISERTLADVEPEDVKVNLLGAELESVRVNLLGAELESVRVNPLGAEPGNVTKCESLEGLLELVSLAKDAPIHVRFIEVMPIGYGKDFEYIDEKVIIAGIEEKYGPMTPYSERLGNGPSHYYHIKGFRGKIGFISAISHKFCDSCNRVRLTSQGFLKTCLQYELGGDLRNALRSGASVEEITRLMEAIITKKPEGHVFEEQDFTEQEENKLIMSEIGG
jgi:cyclic pyranopterin phosphate synthase